MQNNYNYTIYTLQPQNWLEELTNNHEQVDKVHKYVLKVPALDGDILDMNIIPKLPDKYLIIGEHLGHIELRGSLNVTVNFEGNKLELWNETNL